MSLTEKHYFIADFYCGEVKLIVELDGAVHNRVEQKERDKLRTEIINSRGIKVLRFKNSDLESKIEEVLNKITIELISLSPFSGGEVI